MQPKRCCGLCNVATCLNGLVGFVLLTDIFQTGLKIYFMLKFGTSVNVNIFSDELLEHETDEGLQDI